MIYDAISCLFFYGMIGIFVFFCYMISVCIESKHIMTKNVESIKHRLDKIEILLIGKSLGVKVDTTEYE